MTINTLNVNISLDVEHAPFLKINLDPQQLSYTEFVKAGYSKFMNEPITVQNLIIKAKDVIVTPHNMDV